MKIFALMMSGCIHPKGSNSDATCFKTTLFVNLSGSFWLAKADVFMLYRNISSLCCHSIPSVLIASSSLPTHVFVPLSLSSSLMSFIIVSQFDPHFLSSKPALFNMVINSDFFYRIIISLAPDNISST